MQGSLNGALRARLVFAGLMLLVTLAAAACSGANAADDLPDVPVSSPDPSTGMCLPGVPDCVDVVIEPDPREIEQLRATSSALLGVSEQSLDPAVRIARRGDETFALTEDYMVGRMTVELDEAADGGYVVVQVVLEAPDGPERFE